MARLISALILLFSCCVASAQSASEAPAEHASTTTIVVFLVLFVGSCLGYIGYILWDARKSKHTEDN
jgi:heme/copper-type cytochrome/quinol oxidase subunit 2